MSRPATTRLKVNAPLGRMPVLQFMAPAELAIDATYQRDLAAGPSQTLIRKIAQYWNWDLCQPLVVARRAGGGLFVIDGQHRLEAARMRGDIAQLPCVVVDYASTADEAASFVHLNQQRRPLGKLDLFKAAVASEDPEANAIVAAMDAAGLSIAPHQNYISWKPGMVSNIGGIETAWRTKGAAVTTAALGLLSEAFAGQVLRYAGTIFPGILAVVADEYELGTTTERRQHLVKMLASRKQSDWRSAIMRAYADNPNLGKRDAAPKVIREEWAKRFGFFSKEAPAKPRPVTLPPPVVTGDALWCDQCDARVSVAVAANCKSQFCSLRKAA